MPTQMEHYERFPHYGIPYSVIGYGTYAEKILYYAHFKKAFVTYQEYSDFRMGKMNREAWRLSVRKLTEYEWIELREDGAIRITPKGIESLRRISARNTLNPKRRKD